MPMLECQEKGTGKYKLKYYYFTKLYITEKNVINACIQSLLYINEKKT